jgi:hypothetical protein
MMPNGLELVELGSNPTVWILEPGQNVEEISQKRTLEGAITQVKMSVMLEKRSAPPVLAIEKR